MHEDSQPPSSPTRPKVIPDAGVILESQVTFEDTGAMLRLVGALGAELRVLEQRTGISLDTRGNTVHIKGQADTVKAMFEVLKGAKILTEQGVEVRSRDLEYALENFHKGYRMVEAMTEAIVLDGGKRVVGRTANQASFLRALRTHDLVFGIGPAGTGKTYLAAAMAVKWLEEKKVRRIILTRPAVESGEKLGYLPGDLVAKINPYLRPLYDALHLLIGPENLARLLEKDILEIAPLGFMRGRTFTQCVAILDEAQNTTGDQMRMFLTRLGPGSRAIVNGDISQVDLPKGQVSGLVEASRKLRKVDGLAFVDFQKSDIVRHPLVEKIVAAYETASEKKATREEPG